MFIVEGAPSLKNKLPVNVKCIMKHISETNLYYNNVKQLYASLQTIPFKYNIVYFRLTNPDTLPVNQIVPATENPSMTYPSRRFSDENIILILLRR